MEKIVMSQREVQRYKIIGMAIVGRRMGRMGEVHGGRSGFTNGFWLIGTTGMDIILETFIRPTKSYLEKL